MTKLILDQTTLARSIGTHLRSYRNAHQALHVDAVSAIAFACMHGRVEHMNTIINGLATNDRTAFKNYIRRLHVYTGLRLDTGIIPVMDTELLAATEAQGKVFTLSSKDGAYKFGLVKAADGVDAAGNRKYLANLCKSSLIDPDAKLGYTRFMDKNNFDEIKTFGDDEVTKAINALVSKVQEPAENLRVKVSSPVLKELLAMQSRLDTIQSANETHDKHKA